MEVEKHILLSDLEKDKSLSLVREYLLELKQEKRQNGLQNLLFQEERKNN